MNYRRNQKASRQLPVSDDAAVAILIGGFLLFMGICNFFGIA